MPWLARKSRAALDVALAAVAVWRARHQVAARPVGELVGKSTLAVLESPPGSLANAESRCGDRWGAAVDRALRWIPGDAACLVRASALQRLVVGRGLPRAEVRIGVRRGPAGFEAHAWVEQDGMSIAEPVTLQGAFSSLDGVTLR
jgi:hypothetical protein